MTHHRDTEGTEGTEGEENVLTHRIIGAAIEVHRILGPGLLESVYETALCYELMSRGLEVHRQVLVPVLYKGLNLKTGIRLDLCVDQRVIIEVNPLSTCTKFTAPNFSPISSLRTFESASSSTST